jgi:hypothetical protein
MFLRLGGRCSAQKAIELQLTPQLACQPAGAPLPEAAQLQIGQPKLHRGGRRPDNLAAVLREQRHRPRAAGVLVEHPDRPAPGSRLRGVDLAEIQHVSLHDTPARDTLALDDRPVAIDPAVLLSLGAPQEQGATLCTP